MITKKQDIRIVKCTYDGVEKFRVDCRTHKASDPDWYNWMPWTYWDSKDQAYAELKRLDAIYNVPDPVIVLGETIVQI